MKVDIFLSVILLWYIKTNLIYLDNNYQLGLLQDDPFPQFLGIEDIEGPGPETMEDIEDGLLGRPGRPGPVTGNPCGKGLFRNPRCDKKRNRRGKKK